MVSAVTVTAWLVALMVTWSPPELVARGPWPELRHETREQTETRYQELAEAAWAVAQANPALFPDRGDDQARKRTAVLLLSLAFFESRFHNRVTTMRGKDKERSDHGRSWCAVQINIGRDGVGKRKKTHLARFIPEGWTGQQLEADSTKCLTVGYRMAAYSLERYGHLGAYTGERRNGPLARHRLDKALHVELPEPYEDFGLHDDPLATAVLR